MERHKDVNQVTKGLTKACPFCRKILLRYSTVVGEGSFETRCPHCDKLVKVNFGRVPFITIAKVTIVAGILLIAGIYQFNIISGLRQDNDDLTAMNDLLK